MAEENGKIQDSAMPEVADGQKFSPGELTASEGVSPQYGFRNERLPEKYQGILKGLVQTVARVDLFARIEEVRRATAQRFYWRSVFDVYYNEQRNLWTSFDSGAQETGDTPLSYPFNIYQSYGRSFISQVGVTPSVCMKAVNPSDPAAARIASSADAMRRHLEYVNNVEVFSEQVARLFWTDGRVILYNRWVSDGARFGYEQQAHVEERQDGLGEGGKPPEKRPRAPKGGSLMTAFGVLEGKVPINMKERADFPFLQISYEIDISAAKSMYPHIADTISGSTPGAGETGFDRNSRLAITQGLRLLAQAGDSHQLPTWSRTWLRPSYFSMIQDEEDRSFMQDNFPDGCMVAFIGDTYAECRNESMDDHFEIIHPLQGDGQSVPSCGQLIMPVQDALNDMTDLSMEYLLKAIPAVIGDKGIFDFAAMSKQKAGPAARWPTKRVLEPQEDLKTKIWAEPKVEPPAFATTFYTALLTDIPQQLTGLYPSSIGDADPNNETKGGILALRDASRGQQGVPWKAFRRGYAKSLEQLIRIEAYYKAAEAEEGHISVSSPGHNQVEVDLEDLHEGSFYVVPDGSEAYPRTQDDIQLSFQALVMASNNGNAAATAILNEPKNAPVLKDVLAIPGLVVPGADETEKQLEEISQLLNETPIPNLQVQAAYKIAVAVSAIAGKPTPPQPPIQKMYRPSVGIDEDFDIHAIELKAGTDWINSDPGQQARRENKQGFDNVRLHLLLHKDAISNAANADVQGKLQQQGALDMLKAKAKATSSAPKSPSESINYKDAGPHVRLQMEAQAGLDGTSDLAQSIVKEHTLPPGPQGEQPEALGG